MQGWIERDVVQAGVDVPKRQAGQRQEFTSTRGLLDIEIDSARAEPTAVSR
jgi:hypothetical protein